MIVFQRLQSDLPTIVQEEKGIRDLSSFDGFKLSTYAASNIRSTPATFQCGIYTPNPLFLLKVRGGRHRIHPLKAKLVR